MKDKEITMELTAEIVRELLFETQIECFDYITENISDLVLFGKETYSHIEGAEVSEFLCVT